MHFCFRDIKRAVSVLQDASKAVAELTILTLKSPQTMKMDKAFGDLVERVEKHFKTYAVRKPHQRSVMIDSHFEKAHKPWEEYKDTFEKAKTTDIEHFTGVKTRLNISELATFPHSYFKLP